MRYYLVLALVFALTSRADNYLDSTRGDIADEQIIQSLELENSARPDQSIFNQRSDTITFTMEGSALVFGMRHVWIEGNYAYCTSYFGLIILDISDITAPYVISRLITTTNCNGIIVRNGLAYICGGNGYLTIVGVVDPYNPVVIGVYEPGMYLVWDIFIRDDIAYLAAYGHGLVLVDISNPTNPQLLSVDDFNNDHHDVVVVDDYALVAAASYLYVYDVSDPLAVDFRTFIHLNDYTRGLARKGDYLYTASDDSGLVVVNISNPATPSVISYFNTGGDAYDVFVQGDFLYVLNQFGSFIIFEITDPANPVQRGSVSGPNYAWEIKVVGNYAFVAGLRSGFSTFDVSDPDNPIELGNYNDGGGEIALRDVQVEGDYAYASIYGFLSLDLTDPSNPTMSDKVGSLTTKHSAIVGDYAYGANTSGRGLEQYDISNPAEPAFVTAYYSRGYNINEVESVGEYIYLVSDTGGLEIITSEGPGQFTQVGYYDAPGDKYYNTLEVFGNYAYVSQYLESEDNHGMLIIDVSDPEHPEALGRVVTPEIIRGVAVHGDYAYVPVYYQGLQIVSIVDPNAPEIVAVVDSFCTYPNDVAVMGNRLYSCSFNCLFDDVVVYDITDPVNPVMIATHYGPSDPFDMELVGNMIYLAGGNGMLILSHEVDTYCGDINADYAGPNISDLTYLVDYFFNGGSPPLSPTAANVDGLGGLDISDLTYIVDYLFSGGPAPACK